MLNYLGRTFVALRIRNFAIMWTGSLFGITAFFMSTLVKTVRATGVTPWVLLERFDRLWGRLFQGGSVQLVKVGPKDLTIELRGARLTRFEYFRTAFIGVVRAGFKLVGVRAAYVKHGTWQASADRFVMSAAWV